MFSPQAMFSYFHYDVYKVSDDFLRAFLTLPPGVIFAFFGLGHRDQVFMVPRSQCSIRTGFRPLQPPGRVPIPGNAIHRSGA